MPKPCPSEAVTTKIRPKVTMTTSSGFIRDHSFPRALSRCSEHGPTGDRVEAGDEPLRCRPAELGERLLANGAVGPGEQRGRPSAEERSDASQPARGDRASRPQAVEGTRDEAEDRPADARD